MSTFIEPSLQLTNFDRLLKPQLAESLKDRGFVGVTGTAWVLRTYLTLFELRQLTPSTEIDQHIQDRIDFTADLWKMDKASLQKTAKQYEAVCSKSDFKYVIIQKIVTKTALRPTSGHLQVEGTPSDNPNTASTTTIRPRAAPSSTTTYNKLATSPTFSTTHTPRRHAHNTRTQVPAQSSIRSVVSPSPSVPGTAKVAAGQFGKVAPLKKRFSQSQSQTEELGMDNNTIGGGHDATSGRFGGSKIVGGGQGAMFEGVTQESRKYHFCWERY